MEKYHFGLYELERYANAQYEYETLLEYKDEYFESLYENIRPSITVYDEHLGRIYLSGQSTEEMAFEIIAAKECYLKRIERAKKRMDLFNQAKQTLTADERQIIDDYYLDHRLVRRKKQLKQAQKKLIDYINRERQKEFEEREEERKNSIMKQVEEWKETAMG